MTLLGGSTPRIFDHAEPGPVALLFIPGFAGHAGEFAAQVAHFGGLRPTLAIDLPTTGDLSITGLADQVAAMATELGTQHFVAVGHSQGGLVALELANRYPERVAGTVILDAPVLLPAGVRVILRALLLVLRTPLWRPALRSFFAGTFTQRDSPAWRAEVLQRLDHIPQRAASAMVPATFAYNADGALRLLSVPTLYVKANVPTNLSRLPATVRAEEILGSGHWVHVHAPNLVNAHVDQLLAAVAHRNRVAEQN
jgi:pimeloyl-ACP methyl ester carboxylesterase